MMKEMQNIFEKLLEILDSENPSESDKNYLNDKLKEPEIKKLVTTYNLLKNTIKSSEHIDPELLGEYIIAKQGEQTHHSHIELIADKIESHLKDCKPCQEEYELLLHELNSISTHLEKSFEEKNIEKQPTLFLFYRSRGFISAVTAVVVLLVSYFGLRIVSDLSLPQYKQMLAQTTNEGSFVTRGRNSLLFQKGLNAIEKKDYEQAINFLKEDISQNRNDNSIFYSYYVLGLTYLNSSESDFLGAFKSYNHKKVNAGINSLEKSIELNLSGYYNNLILDAHYFIAKGYLMLDNKDDPIDHLKIVVNSKGKYYKEAKEFLTSLEKN